jgi:hypothetical protein
MLIKNLTDTTHSCIFTKDINKYYKTSKNIDMSKQNKAKSLKKQSKINIAIPVLLHARLRDEAEFQERLQYAVNSQIIELGLIKLGELRAAGKLDLSRAASPGEPQPTPAHQN